MERRGARTGSIFRRSDATLARCSASSRISRLIALSRRRRSRLRSSTSRTIPSVLPDCRRWRKRSPCCVRRHGRARSSALTSLGGEGQAVVRRQLRQLSRGPGFARSARSFGAPQSLRLAQTRRWSLNSAAHRPARAAVGRLMPPPADRRPDRRSGEGRRSSCHGGRGNPARGGLDSAGPVAGKAGAERRLSGAAQGLRRALSGRESRHAARPEALPRPRSRRDRAQGVHRREAEQHVQSAAGRRRGRLQVARA